MDIASLVAGGISGILVTVVFSSKTSSNVRFVSGAVAVLLFMISLAFWIQ